LDSLEQAQKLLQQINDSLNAFRGNNKLKGNITESEVKLRYDAIEGVLLIARNDTEAMVKAWEKEYMRKIEKHTGEE
jgi:hypothetical protein